jgi:hypothetical protein
MDVTTVFKGKSNIYNLDYNLLDFSIDMTNKLFCTFTGEDDLDGLVQNITSSYRIMYNKLFVLYIRSTNEYVITYNVDTPNINEIPLNTILVHRKKETNTLYTINALNELIKKLNGGVVDVSYKVNWYHYKNCILLTQSNEIKQLNTKIHTIIEL